MEKNENSINLAPGFPAYQGQPDQVIRAWGLRRMSIYFFVLFLFVACQQKKETDSIQKSYFDLTSVVQNDININTINHCGELKSVYVNGVKEIKNLDNVNWQKELQPLLDCDINKPAWKGKFEVRNEKDLTKKVFINNDPKIPVKEMTVTFEKESGKAERIEIHKKINSFIFSSGQTLEYFPSIGFTIRGEQKAALMKDFELNVEVKYNCK